MLGIGAWIPGYASQRILPNTTLFVTGTMAWCATIDGTMPPLTSYDSKLER